MFAKMLYSFSKRYTNKLLLYVAFHRKLQNNVKNTILSNNFLNVRIWNNYSKFEKQICDQTNTLFQCYYLYHLFTILH